MQKNFFLCVCTFAIFGFSANAQEQNHENHLDLEEKTETFTVYGNCGMCERTIEGSLKDETSVKFADWDKETHQMTVSFNPEEITLDNIKQKIPTIELINKIS